MRIGYGIGSSGPYANVHRSGSVGGGAAMLIVAPLFLTAVAVKSAVEIVDAFEAHGRKLPPVPQGHGHPGGDPTVRAANYAGWKATVAFLIVAVAVCTVISIFMNGR